MPRGLLLALVLASNPDALTAMDSDAAQVPWVVADTDASPVTAGADTARSSGTRERTARSRTRTKARRTRKQAPRRPSPEDVPVPIAHAAPEPTPTGGGILYALLGIPLAALVGYGVGRRGPDDAGSRDERGTRSSYGADTWRDHMLPRGPVRYEPQNAGERRVSAEIRRHLGPPDWHLMNHVTLPIEGGTTQVDHILVSRHGVFVIETKHHAGFILVDAMRRTWMKYLGGQRYPFQNPIHQNYRHVCAVRAILDFLPEDAIRSLVVFTGDATFGTELPAGVVTLDGLIAHLRAHDAVVLSPNRLQFCVGRLETARYAISRETDVEHVANLQRRHGAA